MRHSSLVPIVAALLGACGFDPAGGGGMPDAAIDAPIVDTDGDGIADAEDNCRTAANLDQHDEDADAIGDVCDNCPHLSNSNQASGDGDAVGDLCDPDPAGPNHIEVFLGFQGATLPAALQPVGLWSVAGDRLRQPSNEYGSRILELTGIDLADVVVETAFDVVGVAPDQVPLDPTRAVSLLTRYTTGTIYGTGYLCSVFDDVTDAINASQISTRFQNNGSVVGGDTDGVLAMMIPGAIVRLSASSNGDAQTCQSFAPAPALSMFTDNVHTTGSIALRTFGVAANFRYLIVIASGP